LQKNYLLNNALLMKKLFTLVLSLAAWFGASAAPVFSTALDTQAEFDLWSVKDVNEDGSTWVFSESNDSGKRTYYNYNGTNDANDWLISPAITIPETGSYIVKYGMTGGDTYTEAMNVAIASTNTVEALAANIKNRHPEIKGGLESGYVLFEAAAGETVYLGFQAVSAANRFRLYLRNVVVEPCENPVDLAVTAIVSPASGRDLGQENVVVKVKNELTNPIQGFDITVFVDDTEAFTETVNTTLAAGEEKEVTLTNTVDISKTRRKYTITAKAAIDGDVSDGNNTVSSVVVNAGDATEPYFQGFEPTDFTDDIKFFNLNEDEGNWGIEIAGWIMNLAHEGVGCIGYNYDKEHNADDWAILDGIKVDAGYHVLKFWVSGDDNHTERLSVHYGNEATPEAMTHELYRIDPLTQGAYQEIICVFELDAPQTIYIGFHAFSDKDENWITIDDVSLDAISATETDLGITNVSSPGSYLTKEMPRDLVFSVRNIAIIDAEPTAKLTIDETVTLEKQFSIKAQQELTLTYEDAFAGLAEGAHNVKLEIVSDVDTKLDNNVAEWQLTIFGDPDILYDFEDPSQLEDLTFRAEDSGVLASDEFGETGWGLLHIGEHPVYGSAMLGGLTWFTDPTVMADRWCVFPQFEITSDDAIMTFNAGSVSEIGCVEKFAVEVSEGDDAWWDYKKELTEDNLTTERVNYSVSLGKYKDKKVYVALHLRTTNGELASFDNIQFFGAKKYSGISGVTVENGLELAVNGDMAVATEEAVINIYDIAGALVKTATGTSVDLSTLPHGTYVARAVGATGTATIKFAR